MKSTIILLIGFISLIVYWHMPQSKNHKFKKMVLSVFGYGTIGSFPAYTSNTFLGILLHANPFAIELGIDLNGIMLIHRPWHGMVVSRKFFPMDMVVMVSTIEILGRIARIELLVKHSTNQTTVFKIPRFFSVKNARRFFDQWIQYSQAQKGGA